MTENRTAPAYVLGIDTSARASVAAVDLADPEGVLASEESGDATSHAEELAGMVSRLTQRWGRPARVAVGMGPGPFTGLRVGVAAAEALAFAWGVPLDTVDSLDALREDVVSAAPAPAGSEDETTPPAQNGGEALLVATDARRREIYWALYSPEGRRLAGPAVGAARQAAERARELWPGAMSVVGEGALLYADALDEALPAARRHLGEAARPSAAGVARIAAHALAAGAALPRLGVQYLRDSDAKLPAQRGRATA
ncbi:tRNA (adenosine(37)-N6)-threonylcarbamoyltransferase complex dimerization subunit type 1 TsaB [Falsarthrobacter nasiphocae]|uniref:tRNA threonylcarbamoyl adenosine modification protein YeaZ n=1 Tax=Falsarthrobacter nasiphocae TaxID=189863 RepID=A0AAE3YIW8_9MICC|nr:tRNA (adenosine(37)-N6)-threonylcarbamoyltransferase complex dimerization subunit type 1 TsaB [Falsarthrobacter nasiphocae]MDR6892561.1 tRNA threonylcarbamoyl adenosine modification protein YeaZ [Falsarthrobacter nasiphocae]